MEFPGECKTNERADPTDQDYQHADCSQHCDGSESVQDYWQGFFKECSHFGLTF